MYEKFRAKFLENSLVKGFISVTKKFKPWGFEGLSLFYVMKYFFEGIVKGSLTTRAVAISYRLLLAIFPLLIILIYLISFIEIQDFDEQLMAQLQVAFPGDTYSFVEDSISTLEGLTNNKDEGVILSIIGFFLMLYYASSSVNAILIGFDESYHKRDSEDQTTWWVRRIVSLGMMMVLGILLVVAVILVMFSGRFFLYLEEIEVISNHATTIFLNGAKWLVVLFLVYTCITTLYNVGRLRNKTWKFTSAGATFATVFFVIGSIGFAWFINNLAQYDKLYGSLGSFLVLLIWINFNFIILLLGFELNTSIKRAKRLMMKKSQIE